jgi:hypothetical protein
MGSFTPPPPLPEHLRPRPAHPTPAPPAPPAPPAASSPSTAWWVKLAIAGAVFAVGAALFRSRPRLAPADLPLVGPDGPVAASTRSIDRCEGANGCLIVYVAPWCGPCKQSLPGDVALADFLKREKGVETTFVVGMDKAPACAEMVRKIGREAFVDESGAWAKKMGVRGVPHFLVTDRDGRVKKRQAGALMAPPEVVAKHLGL